MGFPAAAGDPSLHAPFNVPTVYSTCLQHPSLATGCLGNKELAHVDPSYLIQVCGRKYLFLHRVIMENGTYGVTLLPISSAMNTGTFPA